MVWGAVRTFSFGSPYILVIVEDIPQNFFLSI